jgi:hypothetical protein
MKNTWCCLLFILVVLKLQAQNHFLYIQSENREVFTVSLNSKSYNSSTTGYVIIPRLTSGAYDLTVKFPKNNIPDSKFNVVIERKDVGYSLKSTNSTAAITNIQTFVTHRAGEKPLYASSNLNVSKPDIKSPQTANADERALTAKNSKRGVSKVFEIQGSVGVSLRYVDYQESNIDTIDIVIPVEKTILTKTALSKSAGSKSSKAKQVSTKVESGLELLAVHQEGYNKTCVHLASGNDFDKLRKKMSSETSADKMILELKKAAHNKCFTTIQIKNLTPLFRTEEGKFKFLNAAYPLVYDYIQFHTLEKEFGTVEFVEKFRSILHK